MMSQHPKSRPFSAALLLSFALSACGVHAQQTPEPNETTKVNALVEMLGTQRTWNSRTMLPDPEPDGLVLQSWMERRASTLAGTVGLIKVPALTNPGPINATLAWERAAEQGGAIRERGMTDYQFALLGTNGQCPKTLGDEKVWFAQETKLHANNTHPKLLDWHDQAVRFQHLCAFEGDAKAAADKVVQNTKDADLAALRAELATCSAPYDKAYSFYMAHITQENGAAVTQASIAQRACVSEAKKRHPDLPNVWR